jgi:DNA repair exonuclease SbcCD ATPase subunit
VDRDIQIINDEITSYKRSLSEVEDKLEVLNFLKGIDSSLENSITSDAKELLNKKKTLEESLKILKNEKLKLSKNANPKDKALEVSPQNHNPIRLGNYLSSLNSMSVEEKEENQKGP